MALWPPVNKKKAPEARGAALVVQRVDYPPHAPFCLFLIVWCVTSVQRADARISPSWHPRGTMPAVPHPAPPAERAAHTRRSRADSRALPRSTGVLVSLIRWPTSSAIPLIEQGEGGAMAGGRLCKCIKRCFAASLGSGCAAVEACSCSPVAPCRRCCVACSRPPSVSVGALKFSACIF